MAIILELWIGCTKRRLSRFGSILGCLKDTESPFPSEAGKKVAGIAWIWGVKPLRTVDSTLLCWHFFANTKVHGMGAMVCRKFARAGAYWSRLVWCNVYTVFVFFAMWILQWSTCLPLPTQDSTAFTTTSTVTRSEQTARISPHSLKKVVEKGVDLQVISFCCDRLVTPQTYAIEW